MNVYHVDLKQDPKHNRQWACRALKDALIYPWHIKIIRRKRK